MIIPQFRSQVLEKIKIKIIHIIQYSCSNSCWSLLKKNCITRKLWIAFSWHNLSFVGHNSISSHWIRLLPCSPRSLCSIPVPILKHSRWRHPDNVELGHGGESIFMRLWDHKGVEACGGRVIQTREEASYLLCSSDVEFLPRRDLLFEVNFEVRALSCRPLHLYCRIQHFHLCVKTPSPAYEVRSLVLWGLLFGRLWSLSSPVSVCRFN